ncbi:MAG: penicillin-insensitive murein endopeptidase [Pseudomonadota bacterium]
MIGRLLLAAVWVLAAGATAAAERPAKDYFSLIDTPSREAAAAIGSYSRGCLAGAVELAQDGPHWQAMRLSRNRRWGHPLLISFVEELAAKAPGLGLSGVLVGDLSQPRGGPMSFGHTSHQIGLDVDFWFRQMPQERLSPEAREDYAFRTVLNEEKTDIDPDRLTDGFAGLLREAARDRRVARIFVHPVIKRALCAFEAPDGERAWLSKIRPWYGHDAHFHVRLNCPLSARACRGQRPPPAGDGCGAPLDYWFTPAPYTPDPDAKPKAELTLARLPERCRALLSAP